ncbi:MAG: regulatory protein RecX [Legionellales bacterium]|jgi:regulatory protein|nr:regulatory protein RecX [Legionellales bacterium]
MLSRREHGLVELKDKLRNKGFSKDEIDESVGYVHKHDLQNDHRYIEMVIRSRITKGYGPGYIVGYLMQKGIEKDVITSLLNEYDVRWDKVLAEVVQKKFGCNYDDNAKKIRFLIGRGFSYEQVEKNIY